MQKKRMIKTEIMISIMLISFISVSVSVISIYQIAKRTIQKQYIQMAEENINAVNVLTDSQMKSLIDIIREYMLSDEVLKTISAKPSRENGHYYDSKSRAVLNKKSSIMLMRTGSVEGMFLIDNYGRYLLEQRNGKNASKFLKYYDKGIDLDTEWSRQAEAAKGKEVFFSYDVLDQADTECFSIVKVLNDKKKYQKKGIVILTVKKDYFDKVSDKLDTSNMFLLLDEKEKLITEIGNNDSSVGSFYEHYCQRGKSLYKDSYIYLSKENQATGWKIVTGIRKNKLYGDSVYFKSYIRIVLIIVALALWIASSFVTSEIYKPLKKLGNAIDELKNGKRQIGTDFDDSEIGQIGNTIKQIVNNNFYLEKRIVDIELSKKKAQFLLLQVQINPHYLYNTLNSIYILALKYKAEDIAQMTLALSDMFKMALNDGKGYVRVQAESSYIKKYMSIMNYRFHDRFQLYFDIDDEVENILMIKFILQPFVENAILYGLEPKKGEGTITIMAGKNQDELEFRIYDDGVGFDTHEDGHHGYGIHNVEERIWLIYGEGYGVEVDSTVGEGTIVTIRIPIRDEQFYIQSEY